MDEFVGPAKRVRLLQRLVSSVRSVQRVYHSLVRLSIYILEGYNEINLLRTFDKVNQIHEGTENFHQKFCTDTILV